MVFKSITVFFFLRVCQNMTAALAPKLLAVGARFFKTKSMGI